MLDDLALAKIAQRAYTDTPQFTSPERSVFAIIVPVEGVQVVAFRGTDPDHYRDWLADFDCIPEWNMYLGWVSRGFLLDALAVYPAIREALAEKPYAVTGHSKGAAECLIFAGLMRAAAGLGPERATTFGCPRSIPWAPIQAWGSPLTKMANTWDGFDYRYGRDPVREVPPAYSAARTSKNIQLAASTHNIDPIDDHFMVNYVGALANCTNGVAIASAAE